MTITDDDIRERVREYELALSTETEASKSVRDAWRKMVTMFHELLERRQKEEPKPAPEITMQMLINAGLNGFAFELVSQSLAGKKDIKTFKPLRFTFRGVTYTLEPAVGGEDVVTK